MGLPQLPQSFQALAAAAAPYNGTPGLPQSAFPRVTPAVTPGAVPRSFPIPRGPQSFGIKPEQVPPLSQPISADLMASALPPAADPQISMAPPISAADIASQAAHQAIAAAGNGAAEDYTSEIEAQPADPIIDRDIATDADGADTGGHEGVNGEDGSEIQPDAAIMDERPAKAAKTRVGQSPAVSKRQGARAESAAESSYASLE